MHEGFYTAIGLMSGTSLDGIDAAILVTDGNSVTEFGPAISIPYDDKFRARLKEAVARAPDLIGPRDGTEDRAILELELDLTEAHGRATRAVLDEAGKGPGEIDLIGFHGQTLYHAPESGLTWQMGDGSQLAGITGIDVVDDFRRNDMAAGGEGAPLAPVYHLAALSGRTPHKRILVLNIGGVANLTWIDFTGDQPQMLAFDTGPGNALLDDWIYRMTGQAFDAGGKVARRGRIDHQRLELALQDAYFDRPAPKSLDRDAFSLDMADGLNLEDGAATLSALTVAAVKRACMEIN